MQKWYIFSYNLIKKLKEYELKKALTTKMLEEVAKNEGKGKKKGSKGKGGKGKGKK